MKMIKLTQGQIAIVDDEDFERLNKFKWCAVRSGNGFYAMRYITWPDGSHNTMLMHHEVFGLKPNNKLRIRHYDHNNLNNQKANLWRYLQYEEIIAIIKETRKCNRQNVK